jgi:hypothetical protein
MTPHWQTVAYIVPCPRVRSSRTRLHFLSETITVQESTAFVVANQTVGKRSGGVGFYWGVLNDWPHEQHYGVLFI